MTTACVKFLENRKFPVTHARSSIAYAEEKYFIWSSRRIARPAEPKFFTAQIPGKSFFTVFPGTSRQKLVPIRAELRKPHGDQRLLLRYFGKELHYIETAKGSAELIIFGSTLPESFCAALGGGVRRLSEVLEDRGFYSTGDPYVISVKNGVRNRRRALILRLKLTFSAYVAGKLEDPV